MTDDTFSIGCTGNSLTIEIELDSTSSFEMLVLDNIRVDGVPEPATAVLLALGVAFGLRRRR